MLNNLKKTNWQKPTLTSDEPIDIPNLMRNLASDDIYTRGKAMYDLYNNIWYQGRVYAATAFVVPFLIELLQAPSIQDKDVLVMGSKPTWRYWKMTTQRFAYVPLIHSLAFKNALLK